MASGEEKKALHSEADEDQEESRELLDSELEEISGGETRTPPAQTTSGD